MKTKHLLSGFSGLLMVVSALVLIQKNRTPDFNESKEAGTAGRSARSLVASKPPQPQFGLEAALKASDPLRREQLLQQWADSIQVDRIESLLMHIGSDVEPERRSEVRRVLLASWAGRDLSGMAAWFGKRYAADELHQESRDVLIKILTEREPSESFAWMEKTLPAEIAREFYGPFFQHWTSKDPAAAAAKLRQIVEASPTGTGDWNNVVAQVATQWAGTDLDHALLWTRSLPEGAAKSCALAQVGCPWAAREPQAAADYAAGRNDTALLEAVAGTWALSDPKHAVAWAFGLPGGEKRNAAVANAMTVWAQQHPEVAAAYIDELPTVEARNQATLLVASAWAYADPEAAAKWEQRFPEGTVRELVLAQLIGMWAGNSPGAAGQWLKQLPDARSRDVAVGAFCAVLESSDPVAAFEWAKTISDKTIRAQRTESAAIAWTDKHPATGAKN